MTGVEVVILLAGFGCLCASFFVSQNSGTSSADTDADTATAALWTDREEQMIRQRVTEILEERQSTLVDDTEEQMKRLCNDKIMAIDEFSQQLLGKIEQNHQEVVFMYNLMNEKQKEISKMMTQPAAAAVKKDPEVAVESKVTEKTKEASQPEKRQPDKPNPEKKAVQSQRKESPMEDSAAEENDNLADKKGISDLPGNVNLLIQKMHREGKSVLEISKALDIGQGEVKLVIALYGGRRG